MSKRKKKKGTSWGEIVEEEVKGAFIEFLLTFLFGAAVATGVIFFAAPGLITETVIQTEFIKVEADCPTCEVCEVCERCEICETCEQCEVCLPQVECPPQVICPEPEECSVTISCPEIFNFFLQCDEPNVTEIQYP